MLSDRQATDVDPRGNQTPFIVAAVPLGAAPACLFQVARLQHAHQPAGQIKDPQIHRARPRQLVPPIPACRVQFSGPISDFSTMALPVKSRLLTPECTPSATTTVSPLTAAVRADWMSEKSPVPSALM